MTAAVAIKDIARPGTRWSKAAIKRIVKRFKWIKEHNGGALTAEAVLADAKGKNSPLHRHFEWSNSKAAEMWRLHQARHLIQQHYVIVSVPGSAPLPPMRASVIVDLPRPGGAPRPYMATFEAMKQEEYSDRILLEAESEMRSWVNRYERFKELRSAVLAAKAVLRKLAS